MAKATRILIPVKDIKNRAFFIAADHIVSFKAQRPSAKLPGDSSYVIQMLDGSEVVLSKTQCNSIINSGLFSIAKTKKTAGQAW
jgi:hypothetical protein